jgi:hypothetical protein
MALPPHHQGAPGAKRADNRPAFHHRLAYRARVSPMMSTDLIRELDVTSALAEEIAHNPDLLPKQLVDTAVEDHQPEVCDYITELASAGMELEAAPTIAALKWRHGRRTVHALPLHERTLYRAVVNSISDDLVPRVRGREAFDEFQLSPLRVDGARYVVMTDLANYYSSIDLNRLAQELLRRTGRWGPVNWLRGFWEVTSGGLGGIPQMNSASDWIADTFADQLHRDLLRRGFAAWRYADDFRIACPSYGQCVEALEYLDELSRALGLTVNERKTLTPSAAKYLEIIQGPQTRLDRINEEVKADLTGFDPYSWTEVTPEEAEILQVSAVRVIDLWSDGRSEEGENRGGDTVDMAQVLPQTLMVLAVSQNDEALQHLGLLLRYEPQLTPVVARYLRALAVHQSSDVALAVQRVLEQLTLTKWQRLWLLNVMEVVPVSSILGESWHIKWMQQESQDSSLPLRCQAMWSLARSRELGRGAWEGTLTAGSRYASPFVAASVPGIRGLSDEQQAAVAPTGRIEEMVRQWSESTHFLPPF